MFMDAMLQLKGQRFSMKETSFQNLKGLVYQMVEEGHLQVKQVESSIVVVDSIHKA